MNSAGSHAYVSKNFMAKYQQKKAKAQTEKMPMASSSASQRRASLSKAIDSPSSKQKAQPVTEMIKPSMARRRSRSRSASDSEEENERCRSIEMVHSDDLEGDLNLSDCEDEMTTKQIRGAAAARKRKAPARIFKQEVDTNVFNISMATLKTDGELATGDPIFCAGCKAGFNIHSKVT